MEKRSTKRAFPAGSHGENDEINIGKHYLYVNLKNHGHKPNVWKGSPIDKTYKIGPSRQR